MAPPPPYQVNVPPHPPNPPNLQAENKALKDRLLRRNETINKLTADLKASQDLVAKLRADLAASRAREEELQAQIDEQEDAQGEDGAEEGQGHDDDNGDCDEDLPEVLTWDDVYKCSACAFEVVDGYCQRAGCGLQHAWPPEDNLNNDYSISTNTHAIHPDRSLVRRGTTPVHDANDFKQSFPPEEYRASRSDEYVALLQRGATRLMCETFHLEYDKDKGIFAWADWDIYRHFAGPKMQKGDFWKIHLGRQIELDEEDLDGSMFIDDLLEDALMFPLRSRTCKRTEDKWETIEESPGIWLTRLQAHRVDESDDEDVLSETDSDEHDRDSHSSDSDEDNEMENPTGPGVTAHNVYSSGEDMDTDGEDELEDDDGDNDNVADDEEDEDDDFASEITISDSDEREEQDTAFADFTGPDGVWDSDVNMDWSEEEEDGEEEEEEGEESTLEGEGENLKQEL